MSIQLVGARSLLDLLPLTSHLQTPPSIRKAPDAGLGLVRLRVFFGCAPVGARIPAAGLWVLGQHQHSWHPLGGDGGHLCAPLNEGSLSCGTDPADFAAAVLPQVGKSTLHISASNTAGQILALLQWELDGTDWAFPRTPVRSWSWFSACAQVGWHAQQGGKVRDNVLLHLPCPKLTSMAKSKPATTPANL